MSLFPRVHSRFLDLIGSDHRPVLTKLMDEATEFSGRFCFDKRWCTRPEVEQVVRDAWSGPNMLGEISITNRLASVRRNLSKWRRNNNTNSKDRILKLRSEHEAEISRRQPRLARIGELRLELAKAYREEEIYWKQKSHDSWLKDGDKNTKFFMGV